MSYLARTTTTGIAATQTYDFPFACLDEAEVRVVVDGTQLSTGQLTVDLDAGTVTIGTGGGGHTFVGGEVVTVFRETPDTYAGRYVQPADEGALSATALRVLQLQLLYRLQEVTDALGGALDAGPAGGLVTWPTDTSPAEVLPAGDPGQVLVVDEDGALEWRDGVPSTIDLEGRAGDLITFPVGGGAIQVLSPGAEGKRLTSHGDDVALTWETPEENQTPTEIRDAIGLVESRAYNVKDPDVGQPEPAFYTHRDLTVTQVAAVLIGSDTPSVDLNVRHSTDRSAAGNKVFTADVTVTSTSTATTASSGFSDETIPAGSWVWLDVTAVSGTVDWVHVALIATPAVP